MEVLVYLILHVILASVSVIGFSKLMGRAASFLKQPASVGEMLGGLLLAPPLFGALFPVLRSQILTPAVMPILDLTGQIGITLYLFFVGVDFKMRPALIRPAIRVSTAGILLPFVLGGALGFFFRDNPSLFSGSASTVHAVLFLGIAMSVTAFPMLARILEERKLTGTPIGDLALASASLGDLVALGIAMSPVNAVQKLKTRVHPWVVRIFVPLFLASAGMKANLDFVGTGEGVLITGIIIVVGTFGKGLACAWASRRSGLSPQDSFRMGVLMNARGLMELVVLRLGLEAHLITPALYTMMVIMAVVTTAATVPLFSLASGRKLRQSSSVRFAPAQEQDEQNEESSQVETRDRAPDFQNDARKDRPQYPSQPGHRL